MFVKLGLLLALFCVCTANQCMLSPPQRSALSDINKPGSESCINLQPPCGKIKPTPLNDRLWVRGGSNITVVVQKNLDFFNPEEPGFFSISIGSERRIGSMKELYLFEDSDSPALTIFAASVTIPAQTADKAEMILQTRYLPHNHSVPNAFYQCADIIVFNEHSYL